MEYLNRPEFKKERPRGVVLFVNKATFDSAPLPSRIPEIRGSGEGDAKRIRGGTGNRQRRDGLRVR